LFKQKSFEKIIIRLHLFGNRVFLLKNCFFLLLNHSMFPMTKIFLFSVVLILILIDPVFAGQEAAIIVSRNIIPYNQTVEGIKKRMPQFRFKEYMLGEDGKKEGTIADRLKKNPPDFILAVGPEATSLLKNLDLLSPRIFSMVLNPEKIFTEKVTFSGVSMNYPPATILALIKKVLPEVNKVGIFYSPALNADLIKIFEQEKKSGIRISPFPINSSAEIRATIKAPRFDPDMVLFIPDQIIIKKKLIHYIIEECLFRNIPTIGFNTWFARSGALAAFYLDYQELGEQTAELALKVLKNRQLDPRIEAPENLKIILNLKMAEKFDLQISDETVAASDQVVK